MLSKTSRIRFTLLGRNTFLCFYIASFLSDLPAQSEAADALMEHFSLAYQNGQYTKSILLMDSAFALRRHAGLSAPVYYYLNKGAALGSQGQYPKALEIFQQGLALAESRRDKTGQIELRRNMGNVQLLMGKYVEARTLFQQAMNLDLNKQILQDDVLWLYQMGLCAFGENNLSVAEGYIRQITTLQHEYKELILNILMSKLFMIKGNFPEACSKLLESYRASGNMPDWQNSLALHIMSAWLELDNTRRSGLQVKTAFDDPKIIKPILLQALNTTQSQNVAHLRLQALLVLSHFEENQGQFANALHLQNQYYALRDSIFSQEQLEKIGRLETAFKTREKENQIAVLTAQSEKDKAQAALTLQQHESALLEARTEAERRKNLLRIMEAQRELDTCATQNARIELSNMAMENTRKNEAILTLRQINTLQKTENQRNSLILALLATLALLGAVVAWILYKRIQDRRLSTLRNRLSRDLHDDLGSALSSIALSSSNSANANAPEHLRDALARIHETAKEASSSVKDLVWAMHPDADSMGELLTRMRQFAQNALETQGIDYQFKINEGVEKAHLNVETRRHLYLIYKEALNNAAKYSGASRVDIHMDIVRKKFCLTVWDNGQGFDPDTVKRGRGLQNITDRALLTGGMLKVDSKIGEGTRVIVMLGK